MTWTDAATIERAIRGARTVASSPACAEARREAKGNKWNYFEWTAEDERLFRQGRVRTAAGELRLPIQRGTR